MSVCQVRCDGILDFCNTKWIRRASTTEAEGGRAERLKPHITSLGGKVDCADEHITITLVKSLPRDQLPEDLGDITYPVGKCQTHF